MDSFPALWINLCFSVLETAREAADIVAYRVPQLAETSLFPTADGLLEAHRMVTEKFVAGFEGAAGAFEETRNLMVRSAFLQTDATELAGAMLSISIAATEPARRHVRANAKRLALR
jgi:hypothetical protein